MRSHSMTYRQGGFSLMEVLIAIVIFAVGMLALGSLQGNLARSAADANVRTMAANIAERTIEDLRGFGRIDTDPDNLVNAYADIASGDPQTITDGALVFERSINVTDYFYNPVTDAYTDTAPDGLGVSDFKLLEVTVSWDSANFLADATDTFTAAELGTGEITLSAIVSSLSTQGGARVASQSDQNDFTPFVNYDPGANPDIVSLSLGNSKFKEALTPEPDVIRRGELVETRFDVITYSEVGDNALFLRREEFVAVSCECELRAAPEDPADGGRRPTIWAGDEYTDAEFVAKPYGVPANNVQSPLCDVCCQDHHDGGDGVNDPGGDPGATLYDPFRDAADYYNDGPFRDDHKHYKKDRRGILSLAVSEGDVYVEACKLVRKDGFFRVAQDFRQEGINVFPYDYLDQTSEVERYSQYVTGAIIDYVDATSNDYEGDPPILNAPARTSADAAVVADTEVAPGFTHLPTPGLGAMSQQLRSRGIYLDYLSEDLRAVISCLQRGETVESCETDTLKLDKTGSGNVMELIPFFEVQTTLLNRWREIPPNDPVETTNEALETDNTHSRGLASISGNVGSSSVLAGGHTGVLGITDTDPIDPNFELRTAENSIEVIVNNDNPPDPQGRVITGLIVSGVSGLQATTVEIAADDALCNRTPDGFICLVPPGHSPTVTLSNYKKQNRNIVACSADLPGTNNSDDANNPFTRFSLRDVVDGATYLITIEEDFCGV